MKRSAAKLFLSTAMLFAVLVGMPVVAGSDFYVIPIPSMTFKGDWNVSTTYAAHDVVFYDGSSWFSLVSANEGNVPVEGSTKWTMLAQKGDPGTVGPHDHNDLYFTEAETNTLLSTKAPLSHTHNLSTLSGSVTDSQVPDNITINYAATSGSTTNADMLDGNHATAFSLAGHAHNDIYFTEAESDARFVNTTGDSMNGSSTGASAILSVNNAGTGRAVSATSAGSEPAIYATNIGYGVQGYSTGGGSGWSGVYGQTNSTYSSDAGVKGYSTTIATGVSGNSSSGTGVYGQANASGKHAGHFYTSGGLGLSGSALFAENTNTGAGIALWAKTTGTDATAVFSNNGSGFLIKGFGSDGGEHEFAVHNNGLVWTEGGVQVVGTGRVTTPVLEITGGADLSEKFSVKNVDALSAPAPGMVVSIDPESPGSLMISSSAYDRKVAGIVSGAGGVNPGMLMSQHGTEADGTSPVALTGRVYCRADASAGSIEPGDLLTTSHTPGHAMKVIDHTKAQGAVLGKAMTSLRGGQGLVLVLVTLQ